MPKSASPGTTECLWAALTWGLHSAVGKETVDLKSLTVSMDSSETRNGETGEKKDP